MNRQDVLLETSLLGLARFDHPQDEPHRDPREEVSPEYSINFVERGVFDLRVGRRSWRLYPGMVFLARQGLAFRCHHDEEIPRDTCLSLIPATSLVEQGNSNWKTIWKTCAVHSSNRLAYLHLRLSRAVRSDAPSLAVETLATEILTELEVLLGGASRKPYRAEQLDSYTERVEAVRSLLETRFTDPHSLNSLAGSVGISPFHFARVFRELTGKPPHRYLIEVRLTCALQFLRRGASVTEACFAAGFSNLSHFIRLFRRRFGTLPSSFTRPRAS